MQNKKQNADGNYVFSFQNGHNFKNAFQVDGCFNFV